MRASGQWENKNQTETDGQKKKWGKYIGEQIAWNSLTIIRERDMK